MLANARRSSLLSSSPWAARSTVNHARHGVALPSAAPSRLESINA